MQHTSLSIDKIYVVTFVCVVRESEREGGEKEREKEKAVVSGQEQLRGRETERAREREKKRERKSVRVRAGPRDRQTERERYTLKDIES